MMDPILLATAGEDVRLWTMPDLKLHSIKNTTSGKVTHCSCSSNGQMVAYTQEIQGINVAFLLNNESSITIPTSREQSNVCFSTNSKYLVSGGKDCTVSLWDIKTRSIKRTYKDHTSPVSYAIFNFNGNVVASGSTEGEIILTEVQSGLPSHPLVVDKGNGIVSLGYSHFTRYLLASTSESGTLALWDTKESKLVKCFEEHSASASCLSFSPLNDMLLCSTGLDKKMIFYDVCYKKIVKTINADAPLTSCEFLYDGTTVAVGSVTGQISIFDLRHGSLPLKVIPGHKTSVRSVSFQKIPKERPPIKRQTDERPKGPIKSPTEINLSRTSDNHQVKVDIALKRANSYDALGRAEQIVSQMSKDRYNLSTVNSVSTPALEKYDVPGKSEQPVSPIKENLQTLATPSPYSTSIVEKKNLPTPIDPNTPSRKPMKREKSDLSRYDFKREKSDLSRHDFKREKSDLSRHDIKREKSDLSRHDMTPIEDGTPTRSRRPSFERSKSGLSRLLLMNRSSEDVSYFSNKKKEKSSDDLFRVKKNKDSDKDTVDGKKGLLNLKSPFKKKGTDHGKRSDESETSSIESMSIEDKKSSPIMRKHRISNRSNDSEIPSSPLINDRARNDRQVQPTKEGQNSFRGIGDGTPSPSRRSGDSHNDEVFEFDTPANNISTKFIEKMINEAMEDNRIAIHRDMVNLQVEFIRQMEIQQNQIQQMLEHYSVKDDLVREILKLRAENSRLVTKY